MIHIVIGTRAQLIKMLPIMKKLNEKGVFYNFVFLAQHHETINEILEDFELKKPDVVFCSTKRDIVSALKLFFWGSALILKGIAKKNMIFQKNKNGVVLVHGDALPLFLGAFLGKMQGLKVAAVEAGLRSYDFRNPFPEELIRVITSHIGLIDIFYCQDEQAVKNAKKYNKGCIVNTYGNTIVDSIDLAVESRRDVDQIIEEKYAIITLHRFENIADKDKLKKMLDLILKAPDDINLKFILHPPTRKKLLEYNLYDFLEEVKNVELLSRMNFMKFNQLLAGAEYIITDGGSNQEECAYLGVPCLIMRSETERSEGLDKNAVLSNYDPNIIVNFQKEYHKLKKSKQVINISPSEVIVADIIQYIE